MSVTEDELNAELQKVTMLIADFGAKLGAWSGGIAGGGPANDGSYPLPIGLGAYVSVKCPAQLAAEALQPKFMSVKLASGSTFPLSLVTHRSAVISLEGPAPNTAVTVQLPPNAPPGWTCTIIQNGTGRHTFALNGGQSMINRQNYNKTAGQGSPMTAWCVGQTSGGLSYWFLFGDMTI